MLNQKSACEENTCIYTWHFLAVTQHGQSHRLWGHDTHVLHMCAGTYAYTALQSPKAELIPECRITVCQAKSGHAVPSKVGVLTFNLSLLGTDILDGTDAAIYLFILVLSHAHTGAHKVKNWVEKGLSGRSLSTSHCGQWTCPTQTWQIHKLFKVTEEHLKCGPGTPGNVTQRTSLPVSLFGPSPYTLFYTRWLTLCVCRHFKWSHFLSHPLRRQLLAELVEDENIAIEIARLEEEFRRLTEENRTLVTVHKERAQQLENLCLTSGTRQDSSWPLTSIEPETSIHPADTRPWIPSRDKGTVCAPTTQWIS